MEYDKWESDDGLLGDIEAILRPDIDDLGRRRFAAMIIKAHMRSVVVHSLREQFDKWIGVDGAPPTPEEAKEAMRAAIVFAGGFDHSHERQIQDARDAE